MWDNANCLALPINNVLRAKLAKMACVQMDVLITKIVLDKMSVSTANVLILALLEKLVDQTVDAKPKTKLNIALVLLVLLVFPLPSKDVSGSLMLALVSLALQAISVSKATACLAAAFMRIVPRVNNAWMECA